MVFRTWPILQRVSRLLGQAPALACLLLTFNAPAQIVVSDYSSSRPLQVMATGDSITDDCSYNGAWRQFLQPLLQTNGYAFAFVGRQTSIASRTFTETRHEGYCGSVIAPPGLMPDPVHGYAGTNVYLLKTVADALMNTAPDLVLVVMGANDVGRGRDPFYVATNDMPRLLDLIYSNLPDASIIVSKTTILSNAVSGYATNAPNVPIYNAALQAMVNQRVAAGQRIALADMYSAVDYSTMFNNDHLHPNLVGLNAMAREFLVRIELLSVRSNLVTTALIPAGAVWRYSDAGQDLGTNWVDPDYDESGWSSGPARLGYGDSVAATTIGYGPDSKRKNPTTYFRYSFVAPDRVVFTNLNFRLAREDGALVWLNGQEAFRMNMPDGPISYTNRALRRVSGDPGYIFYPTNLAFPSLSRGTNVVAVEVHINSPVIPSFGFDMELLAMGYAIPAPTLSVGAVGASIVITWSVDNSDSYSLYWNEDLRNDAAWVPQPALVQTNGNQHLVKVNPTGTTQFFRLQKQ